MTQDKLISLVILDRDGVINKDSDQYIKSPDDFKAIPGSIDAIKMLSEKGIPVAIATNQSGIGRGFFSYATVCTIHQKLFNLLGKHGDAINYIAMCPHRPDEKCNCRKPKTGMLSEISDKLMIPLNKQVYFVGDSIKDIEAAKRAGCTPILVKTGKTDLSRTPQYFSLKQQGLIFNNLQQFAASIV